MKTINAVDHNFQPYTYEVFSEGDVIELLNTAGMVNIEKLKSQYVVEKFCPQYGVADQIKTTCGVFIYAFRCKLLPYRIKVKKWNI